MTAKQHIVSIIETGLRGVAVDVECHVSNSLPAIVIVGFANKSIDEAKERLRGAFASSNLVLPRKRIVINLAPGDIPKSGTGFDLAMAAAILQSQLSKVPSGPQRTTVFIGELGLDGSIRPVRGIIGKLLAAQELGFVDFFIPYGNLKQAQLIPNITLYPIQRLQQLAEYLDQKESLASVTTNQPSLVQSVTQHPGIDFQDVAGQSRAKRALEIAAAGGHNLLLNGPPGTGKSMLARALPSILPPLTYREMLEVTHLHSLSAIQSFEQIVSERPFRTPHHSASLHAIIGGGIVPRPGEISLSHRGVLFFDEFLEFPRSVIEALRQPLEEKCITITRTKDTIRYPADFLLVATANPCPCGFYGTSQDCQCPPYQLLRYRRKLSGPIIDRIDLYVEVEPPLHDQLLQPKSNEESSVIIRQRVIKARHLQANRSKVPSLNSSLDNRAIKIHAHMSSEAQAIFNQAARQLQLSGRGYVRCVKVARTIADLAASPTIEATHISEALQFRARFLK